MTDMNALRVRAASETKRKAAPTATEIYKV